MRGPQCHNCVEAVSRLGSFVLSRTPNHKSFPRGLFSPTAVGARLSPSLHSAPSALCKYLSVGEQERV